MRLLIFEIDRQSDLIIVSGVTACGTIRGIWESEEIPAIDTVYHVELIINHLTELSAEQNEPAVYVSGDVVTFQGVCEAADEDVCYVRFDTDWLELISIAELSSLKAAGDYISFSADCHDIGIYPYTL